MTSDRARRLLFEVAQTLGLTLIIFFVIQSFVAQPYKVQQQSMEHTLEPDQYVLVDKLTPRWDTYKRGDIVVFTPPDGWTRDDTPFIKRVIGQSGDTVTIKDDGGVYVNGTAIDERGYLFSSTPGQPPQATTASLDQSSWTVPPGELFLMGDHRANSEDSRTFGPVPISHLIGRAWLRYFPVEAFGVLPTPTYGTQAGSAP